MNNLTITIVSDDEIIHGLMNVRMALTNKSIHGIDELTLNIDKAVNRIRETKGEYGVGTTDIIIPKNESGGGTGITNYQKHYMSK